MPDFDNTNRGVLFPESNKTKETSPDYTGNINIDGKELRLAGWKKTGKSGVPFLSLSVSEFQQKSGYDSFKEAGQRIKTSNAPSVDVPLEDIGDQPIDLSEIPF